MAGPRASWAEAVGARRRNARPSAGQRREYRVVIPAASRGRLGGVGEDRPASADRSQVHKDSTSIGSACLEPGATPPEERAPSGSVYLIRATGEHFAETRQVSPLK